MRASTNISLKNRSELILDGFLGVDFSSSPLKVKQNRASKMQNFINEYGVNKKRNGWYELFRIKNSDGESQEINGIFPYKHNEHDILLVHAGTHIYKVTLDKQNDVYTYNDITLSSTYEPAKVSAERIKNQRSQAFVNKGKCYIVGCGDFLVYGTWDEGETYELRRVANNEDTYIPTTTVSIDPDSVENDTNRSSLDAVNLLSNKRINKLLGSNTANETWTLDTKTIDNNTDIEITLETLESNEPVTYLIQNNQSNKKALYKVKKNDESITPIQCGSVNFDKGQITFTIATTPQIEGNDNIYVQFVCNKEGNEDMITKCEFGILFGVGGNTDRLFLSGNPDYPNIDFHSGMDDYTYFEDTGTAALGSDSSAINGYVRLSDNALVILKDGKLRDSKGDATIFYRQGQYREYYDANGNLDRMNAIFPSTAGNTGEVSISRYACANFGGDNLILSANGVFGIVLANNVATAERYTRERSRSINEQLTRHEHLDEAVGIVYKNRYYLAVDGVCYIADARFKYAGENNLDGSYNYEWWYWTNMPVRVWAEINNQLWFGCSDGRICTFDNNYSDRTIQDTGTNGLTIDIANNRINYTAGTNMVLKDNDIAELQTDDIYSLFMDCGSYAILYGQIYVDEKIISKIYDGIEVYADQVGMSGLEVNTKYIISGTDRAACTFWLANQYGEKVGIIGEGFRLLRKISNTQLYLSNITDSSFMLKSGTAEDPLFLATYNGITHDVIQAQITHKENVVAEWYTPTLDLGTNADSKTLLEMTICTEPEINGRVSFGYNTRYSSRLQGAKGINVFSFDDLSFENFTFATGFASSYTVKCNERNFNFIIFRFVSDDEYNCAINSFTILFKVNKSNRGVR